MLSKRKIPLLLTLLFLLFVLFLSVWAVKNQRLEVRKEASEPASVEEKEFSQIRQLEIGKPIYKFTVNASLTLEKENSFFRLILIDQDQKEHLVYEAYPLIVENKTISFDNACEETCVLAAIFPDKLRVEGLAVDFEISQTSYEDKLERLPAKVQSLGIERSSADLKKEKESLKIQKLNEQIKAKGMKWIAGETSVSKLSYAEKKKLFSNPDGTPVDKLPNLQGFEYYKGGIFEIKSEVDIFPQAQTATESANFPDSWDWRNQHGQNWLTSIKYQGDCNSCWAFAAVGTVEANTNLYFNNHLNPNLSEQELLSCSSAGSCNGGYPERALQYIQDSGIVDEDCFPYLVSQIGCQRCADWPNRQVKIDGFNTNIYTNEDLLKYDLINYGVLSSGVYSWNHVMPLVGWETETDNSPVWIFKNSWGAIWGENGYAIMRMSLADMYPTNSVNLPIFFSDLNQSISCTDNDEDGYCYWGLSQDKPNTCSSSCNPIKDCDDSNPNLQIFDQKYNCRSVNDITPIPTPLPESGQAVYLDDNATITVLDSDKKLVITPQFTLEVWLKPVYRNNYFISSIIKKDVDYPSSGFDIGLGSYINDPQKRHFLRFDLQVWDDVVLPNDEWTHLAVVRNGIEMNFFINGVLVKNYQLSTADTFPTIFSNLYLGIGTMKTPATEKQMFNGSLDELRISNIVRGIPSSWQSDAYLNPLEVDSGTVALWRFDGNLLDSGPNSKDARGRRNIQYVEGKVVSLPTSVLSPTPTLPPVSSSVKGQVNLQRAKQAPDASWVTELMVSVCGQPYPVTTDESGNFTIANLTTQTCDIDIKGSHTLGNVKRGVVLNPGENVIDLGTLLEGDAKDDNCIDIFDFYVLKQNFNTADPKADFNQDGLVDIHDFYPIKFNFGKCGDLEIE